ncbi:MAG: type II toxin-antitoxin system Phd/YefM family antitoxin [Magnetococcales bacterium]|nr:type II toxin-antitoxin system Phd/YefM family antitoxin [Magnetococcales bacterium]
MQRISARDAKNGFGYLIDLARAEPVAIEKYGRPVVVVMAVEEYERLVSVSGKDSEPVTPKKQSQKGKPSGDLDVRAT